jgi:hypothetical protein
VAGGRPRRREVAGGDHVTAALPRARGPGNATMGRRGLLTSGPCHNSFSKIPKLAQTLYFNLVTFPLSKIHQNLNRHSLKHNEQLSFLSQL